MSQSSTTTTKDYIKLYITNGTNTVSQQIPSPSNDPSDITGGISAINESLAAGGGLSGIWYTDLIGDDKPITSITKAEVVNSYTQKTIVFDNVSNN